MTTTAFRTSLTTLLATALAATAVAAVPAAEARQSGTGSPTTGRACKTGPGGGTMADGDVTIHRSRNQRWTQTCTDGTLCTSIGVKQGNGRWNWRYECEDVPTIR